MRTPSSLDLALRGIVQGNDAANPSTRTRWPTWRRGCEQWAGSSSPSSCDRSREWHAGGDEALPPCWTTGIEADLRDCLDGVSCTRYAALRHFEMPWFR